MNTEIEGGEGRYAERPNERRRCGRHIAHENAYVFESLEQVREISAEWLQSYNEERPHDALAGLPPAMYRARLEARSSPLKLSP